MCSAESLTPEEWQQIVEALEAAVAEHAYYLSDGIISKVKNLAGRVSGEAEADRRNREEVPVEYPSLDIKSLTPQELFDVDVEAHRDLTGQE